MMSFIEALDEKKFRDFLYLGCLGALLFLIAIFDTTLLAVLLGQTWGHYYDPLFVVAVVFGIVLSVRIDAMVGGVFALLVYRGLGYFQVRSYHKELGIFESDFDLAIRLLLNSLFPVLATCILVAFLWTLLRSSTATHEVQGGHDIDDGPAD